MSSVRSSDSFVSPVFVPAGQFVLNSKLMPFHRGRKSHETIEHRGSSPINGGHTLITPDLESRALGSYLGLAIGDALGATVEFMTACEIAHTYKIHRNLIGGGWLQLRPGQITDDTQMAMAFADALITCGGWNHHAVADSFVQWMRTGPVDIGNTCRRGIRRYLLDGSLEAPLSPEHGGNGAAMRNLPAVFITLGEDDELLKQYSLAQAHITHNHPLSDAAILALGRVTRLFLEGGTLEQGREIADALVAEYRVFRYQPWSGQSSGYIVDTLQTVFDGLFNTDSFEDCLIRAVNRGGDADTVGAICGQLAGALYGVKSIPARWQKQLDSKISTTIQNQVRALLNLSARRAQSTPVINSNRGIVSSQRDNYCLQSL